LDKVNTVMKLAEIVIPTTKQTNSPQSPGSRGLALNKNHPTKRYFTPLKSSKKTNRQK